MRGLPLLCSLVLLATAAALPVSAAEAKRDLVGAWLLGGVSEGDPVCGLTLSADETIGGWAVISATDCAGKFPISEDFYAWNRQADGAIGIVDATRKLLLKFSPVGIGGYVAKGPDGQMLSLDRPSNDPEPTEQERMSGRWGLTAFGGEPLCSWESTAAEDGLNGALKPLSPCNPEWTGKMVTRWERAKGRIMLIDAAGKMVLALPGDSIEGFFSPVEGDESYGFTRQWD